MSEVTVLHLRQRIAELERERLTPAARAVIEAAIEWSNSPLWDSMYESDDAPILEEDAKLCAAVRRYREEQGRG